MKRYLYSLLLACPLLPIVSPAEGEVRRALVIGVADYPGFPEEERLKYADQDAQSFGDFLKTEDAGRFEVTTLLNGNARRNDIWGAVERIKREPVPDTLFVFFSGHAELESRTKILYLMPDDGDKKILPATGISAEEFLTHLKAIGPTNLIVFLDACHSGVAILGKGNDTEAKIPGALDDTIARLNKEYRGTVMVFASAASNERSWEDDQYKQGIFTHFLIKGLQGDADVASGAPDHRITAGKLKMFLDQEVPKRAQQIRRPPQTPVVSAEFNSGYVLALAKVATTVPSLSDRSNSVTAQIQKLRETNPELALMLHVAAIQSKLEPYGPNPAVMEGWLRESLDGARVRRTATIKLPLVPEALAGYAISSDATLFVACVEPSKLVAISLKTGEVTTTAPLTLQAGAGRRQARMDSCNISVSPDNRLAVVRSKSEDGPSGLSLIALDKVMPTFPVASYDFGVFVDHFLCLGKGDALTLVSTDSWIPYPSQDIAKPIEGLVSEPTSDIIEVVGAESVAAYRLNRDVRSVSYLGSEPRSNHCVSTKDLFVCEGEGQWRMFGNQVPQLGDSFQPCGGRICRLFASGASVAANGWSVMLQGLSEPNVLRFMKADLSPSQPLHVPEPVVAGRLSIDGSVVVVGQNGGIYRFSSLAYEDCCSIPVRSKRGIKHIAAGIGGVTAVLSTGEFPARLEVFDDHGAVRQVRLSDAAWVLQMAWGDSNRLIALAGKSRARLVEVPANNVQEPMIRDVECGVPFALDPTSPSMVCTAADGGGLQVRNARTTKIEKELTEHVRPVQAVAIGGGLIGAAGSYSARSLTLVTLWNALDGKLISQRTCPFVGTEGTRPLTFVRQAHYFAQLDTPSRMTTRESVSCEGTRPQEIGELTDVRSANGDFVVFIAKRLGNLYFGYPFQPGIGWPLRVEAPIDDLSLSADGLDIVLLTGGRVLRIPTTYVGVLDLARALIPREFTNLECQEFFPSKSCPKLVGLPRQP